MAWGRAGVTGVVNRLAVVRKVRRSCSGNGRTQH
jgi:hypothetical protein